VQFSLVQLQSVSLLVSLNVCVTFSSALRIKRKDMRVQPRAANSPRRQGRRSGRYAFHAFASRYSIKGRAGKSYATVLLFFMTDHVVPRVPQRSKGLKGLSARGPVIAGPMGNSPGCLYAIQPPWHRPRAQGGEIYARALTWPLVARRTWPLAVRERRSRIYELFSTLSDFKLSLVRRDAPG